MAGAASVLQATAGPLTQYSNVYDLAAGVVQLYFRHDFSRSVPIVLRDELAKGAHVVEIADLFQE